MKREFLLFLICLLVGSAFSQTYNFSFTNSDFLVVENNGKHIIDCPSSFNVICNTCEPILPSCVKNILLPPNKKIINFTFTYSASNWQSNVVLETMPAASPTDENNDSVIPCSYDIKVYPDSIVRYGGQNTLDRYQYVSFIITPFVYDADNRILSFVSQVNITIELEDSLMVDGNPTKNHIVKRIVNNPSDLELYCNNISQRSSTQDIDYLIITTDSLKSSFEPLRIWKTQKGVYTQILTIEDIIETYVGATPQICIKKCVQDFYENHGLKWLLLGGDDTIIPTLNAYCEVGNRSDFIPADIFYGCFDGAFDWNANGNDTIGEVSDNVNFNQKINISRLPIRTKSQVNAYIRKLLRYEQKPLLNTPSILLCARELWGHQAETNYSDAHLKSDIFINNYISPYFSGNIVRFYDTFTDFPGGADYQLNTANVTTQLSNNYNFLHFASHGGCNNWGIEDGNYYSYDVNSLTNSMPMVIATMACSTNAFDLIEPCLSEAFIQKPAGGAIAYLGSSRYGWGYKTLNKLGASFQMNSKFFTNLFDNVSIHFSEIVKLLKLSYSPYVLGNYNDFRWLVLSNNAVGDAELPIYTTIPNQFKNVTLIRDEENITVSVGDIDGCTITMTNIATGGNYYSTDTNSVSTTFTDVPGSFTIVITKDNYIPYITSSL